MSRDISVHTFRHGMNGSVIHVDSGLCEDIDYDFFNFCDSPLITEKSTDSNNCNVIDDEEKEDGKRKSSVKLTPCDNCKDLKSGKVIDQSNCNTKLTDVKNEIESSVQLTLASNSRETDKNDLKEKIEHSKEDKCMNLRDLMNCIAYSQNKDKCDDDDDDDDDVHIVRKVCSISPEFLSLSTDTTTDITDVTPCPSSSGCSSMSRPEAGGHSMDKSHKDAERKQQTSDEPAEGSSGSSMKLLLNALDSFDRQNRKSVTSNISSNQKNRLGRKNMSFSNERYWQIERENKILLRKLECLHKACPKQPYSPANQPRLSSSALNRRQQQAKIDHDNMILLKKIEQAKPSVHIALRTVRR